MSKKALITGVGGQDGSYLVELLLSKGYEVHGIIRRSSIDNKGRLSGQVLNNKHFLLIEGDITDSSLMTRLIADNKYDEIYNLAAQSHVGTSFSEPLSTFNVDATAVLIQLEAVKNYSKNSRFYHASTSELFGSSYSVKDEQGNVNHFCGQVPEELVGKAYQGIETPLKPNSPYAIAKLAAHESVRMYREAYGIYACAGILFNHESPRRGDNFVTQKIVKYIGKLKRFLSTTKKTSMEGKLKLGNLNAYRDWGHSKDYIHAMWLMLQAEKPKDYVVATGVTCSIHTFLAQCFQKADLPNWQNFVEISNSEMRPHDVNYLRGDSTAIREELGWNPFFTLDRLIGEMLHEEIHGSN